MNKDKSQKRKNNNINKTELWNVFDSEIENPEKQKVPLECIYGSGNREICERCETILAFSDEGFLTCTNNKCGIIYKDLVDHGAEWRYYGADDNQSSDPTRCGMPINPLLRESSYGCKVLCFGPMSYEMRKIRRYTEWQSMPYKEKSQYDEFQIITTMAQHAGIPKMIIDDAIVYHKKISEYEWEIPKTGKMNVPVRIFASEKLLEKMREDETFKQASNTAVSVTSEDDHIHTVPHIAPIAQ
jgi:transcription initiation factor TFIIIB Brf1 subunit/transcription initiation factor TFIIB